MTIREATIQDIGELEKIRNAVKENALSDPALINADHYEEFLTRRGKGWVCEMEGIITGFAVADLQLHNVWALFVRPGFEGKGIGRMLHDTMLNWYFSHSTEDIWLSTAPGTRAELFYRKAGWTECGTHGNNETKFEMSYTEWFRLNQD